MRTVPPPLPTLPVNPPPPLANSVTRFYGKTWVLTAQFLVLGGFAAFALGLGPLFLLGVMKDARGEPAVDAGVALTLIGLALTPVALVAGYGVYARRRPIIRLCREGIELRLVGRTSLDDVPVIGGLVKWAWAAASLQGFRTRQLRVEWNALQGCQIGGLPMMRWIQITWLEPRPAAAAANAPPYAAPPFVPACVVLSEAEIEDRLERIDEAVARMLWDPALRAGLPSWSDQR